MRMPAAAKHGVERGGELRVAVANQKPQPVGVLVEVHEQVTGGLGDPLTGGMSGDADQVHPSPVEFDHKQDVQPGQPDRLDGDEVTGQGAGGLGV
jgi:hypothetical protein